MEEATTNSPRLATVEAGATVAADLKTVIRDIQVLLKAATVDGKELAGTAREQLEIALLKLQARLIEVEKTAAEKAAAAGRAADAYVREKPWHAIAAAAALGVVLGMLISRD